MPELLDEEMTGVRLETKWLDKLAWLFIVWSSVYLSAYFILPVEPSLVQFPLAEFSGLPDNQDNWLVRLAELIIENQRKVLASYLVLNLLIMLLAYGLLHRVRYISGAFVLTLYLTILFHLLKWVVMVVYLKGNGLDEVSDDAVLLSVKRMARLLMYAYTAYIILMWFGFRWMGRRLRSKDIMAEFDQSGSGSSQPQ